MTPRWTSFAVPRLNIVRCANSNVSSRRPRSERRDNYCAPLGGSLLFRACHLAPVKQVVALGHFDYQGMCLGSSVVAHAGYLPGNFHPGIATGDRELIVLNFA